ncbi:MAG: hypothetical protein ACD_44C00445G0003 [uncultured bacterium]|nr:MAG: hypothetical protein ACD_44C00445G0003 [uncultured bacterium]OGT24298.1 MAG: adenylosuccinate lyase [Gammaproteobacteria bacterium RIFCSPHIGHO2_12_38_15]OGT68259.1 MAG: adenylosuccinate lyase [Gammaproteobacteria bacterium RIFCSPLOWO2_02_FULL_38_11]OGT77478.1 MAG: adenylosuccinate lyase [Gammaproteobacteria bacterium RIFCSPLOWO2_12_FULL_38_14]
MKLSTLSAISPLDGRYGKKTENLRGLLSEYGLIRARLFIEIEWLVFLNKKIPDLKLNQKSIQTLKKIYKNFNELEAKEIKKIENKINHDVKAVEYYLKNKMEGSSQLKKAKEFVHFACTSDDINNLAYAILLQELRKNHLLPILTKLKLKLKTMALDTASRPMLSRTHGQAATPTTLGKEIANFLKRLERQTTLLSQQIIFAKINGAVGNFNAHRIAYPQVAWPILAKKFVEQLRLSYNSHTTQIEPHDGIAEYCHVLFRINTLLIHLCRDCWAYISLAYFSQKKQKAEVGSSTMPHKINPIDFENAEGNLSLANALFHFFAERLPVSRWQRDLVDSTLFRNLGIAQAYSLLAYETLLSGLNKLQINEEKISDDLEAHWEVLTEAVQTVMRRYRLKQPYEQLKMLSRGKKMDKETLHHFIDKLHLPSEVKKKLKALTPKDYIGFAKELAKQAR